VSKSDRVGGVRRVIGLVFAVVVANSCRGGEAITEELAKLGEQGLVDWLTMKGECRHGGGRKTRKLTFKHYSPARVAATRIHKSGIIPFSERLAAQH
jgi:hypothetical protein